MRAPALLLATVLPLAAGCPENADPVFVQCDLDLALDTDAATPGEVVAASGRPLTEPLDTVVRVGAVQADVLEITRDQQACVSCESCRRTAGCDACEPCTPCAEDCAGCVETMTFEVPDLQPGPADVTVVNAYGTSPPLPLEVVPAEDTDAP